MTPLRTRSGRWRSSWLLAALALCACQGSGKRPYLPADAGRDAAVAVLSIPQTEDLVPDWHLAWANGLHSTGWNNIWHSASDGASVFVTGFFCDELVLGEGEPGETTLSTNGSDDLLLARYWLDGTLDWATSVGGGPDTMGAAVDARADGSTAVAGQFSLSAVFGAGEPNETALETVHPECEEGAFVASYREDGALGWVSPILGAEPLSSWDDDCYVESRGVVATADGGALAAGRFEGVAVFDLGGPGEVTLTSAADMVGDQDGFLARYEEHGGLLWVVQLGGPGRDGFQSVEPIPAGGFYALGFFSGAVTFGGGEPAETTLTSLGEESAFLARYGDDGTLTWVVDLGIEGDVNRETGKIAVFADGGTAVNGRFRGRMESGGTDQGFSWVESPEGGRGIFVARYSEAGERLWCRVATCEEFHGTAWDLAPLADGSLVVVGRYEGAATFGIGEPNETMLEPHGGEMDSFVAQYVPEGDLDWALGWGSSSIDSFSGVEVIPGVEQDVEYVFISGFFSDVVTYGTGGGDEITLTCESSFLGDSDGVLLRLDRGGEPPG